MTRLSLTILLLGFVASTSWADTGWKVSREVDPLTDEKIVTASLRSATTVGQEIVVQCSDRRFQLYVTFNRYFLNKLAVVRYRIDKKPLIEASWMPSADSKALLAGGAVTLARDLMDGSSILIEANDSLGQSHRASFQLAGAGKALPVVFKECGRVLKGMERTVNGLRPDVAQDLERWGPKTILVSKKILAGLNAYGGPIDSTIEPEFAIAFQSFFDGYMQRCSAENSEDWTCSNLNLYKPNTRYSYLRPWLTDVLKDEAPEGP